MSSSKKLKYPPEEILNPSTGFNPNYEHIILWMLSKNDVCGWSDFTEEISQSTLSNYLNLLSSKGYIERIKRGQYKITLNGIHRFNELETSKDLSKRHLNYPPRAILKDRNYDHIILWMVYNNDYCKWSDFLEDPLSINQSSLSKNLNLLLNKGYVKKENKEYKITSSGKSEYFNVLKSYNLDRQSILEEESKRIEAITKKTIKFFEEYQIVNTELKFRFLNNILKLDYAKIKDTLNNEEDFNKILLFLSLNHPNYYPEYISPEEFSKKYNIKKTILDYYIYKIVEENFYPIKFFKLESEQGKTYYFQANEKLEKILGAIVEDYMTKFTYLKKLYEDTISETKNQLLDIRKILDNILADICDNLFNKNLCGPLGEFLPEYIKYLAYKIESEKKLIDSIDKFKGIAWQNIFDEFQTLNYVGSKCELIENELIYELDPKIFDILEPFYLTKLDFLKTKGVIKKYFNSANQEIIENIEMLLIQGKNFKATKLFERKIDSLNEIERAILKDIIATAYKDFDYSIKITTSIIKNNPEVNIGHLFQSLTYLEKNELKSALSIIEKGLEISYDIPLICQKAQILLKKNEPEKALEIVDDSLLESPNNILLMRTKIIIHILYGKYCDKTPEETLIFINSAIKSNPYNLDFTILKAIVLCAMKRYKEVKQILYKIDLNPLKKNPRIDIATYLILAYSYIARGKFQKALKISNQILMHYSDHPLSYLTKALVLGYNLLYKFNPEVSNENEFLEIINKAISLDPNTSNQSRYYQFISYILQELQKYEEALGVINKAIDLDPYSIDFYRTKTHILMAGKKYDEALTLVDNLIEEFPQFKKNFTIKKSYILYINEKFVEALKVIEEIYKLYPDDVKNLNNRSIMLANVAVSLEKEGKNKEALEKKEESIKTAKKLLELAPDDGNYHDSYGEILMKFEKYGEAIKEFEEALSLEPQGFFAYQSSIKMGICYKELGDYDKAREYYEKGKILTERMLPSDKDAYFDNADDYLAEIKLLEEESRETS